MKTIQKTALSAVAATLLSGLSVQSAFAADAPEVSPISANVSVTNDYRYRGISQSNFQPAVQGGFDYAHESGFYIGNWNSSISWISDLNPGVSAPVEMDFYAGFKKDLFAEGFASDLGVLQYYYPMNGGPALTTSPNTTEIYAAQNFTLGPVTGFVKFSYAVTTLFGVAESAGSYYPDLTLNYDTGIWGLSLNGHVGYQQFAGTNGNFANSNLSYTDWKLGVTKDFGAGLSLSAAYVDTNANANYWTYNGKNLGGATGIVTLTKAF
jgi:uncharacterized protein (TIGR02001 family)